MDLKILCEVVPPLFGMANHGQHRQESFDEHPDVYLAPATCIQVDRVALGGVEVRVRQRLCAGIKDIEPAVDSGVLDIGGRPDPAEACPEVIPPPFFFSPRNSMMFGDRSGSEGPWAPPPPNRMNQFDAIPVHNARPLGLRQDPEDQLPMGFQEVEEWGAFRQSRKQNLAVLTSPSVESLCALTLDREQQSKRNAFAAPERPLGTLGDVQPPLDDSAEQINNKVFVTIDARID